MIRSGTTNATVIKSLEAGDVRKVAELQGFPYAFTGLVVSGRQLGRTIGFPTANLELTGGTTFLAATGVYAVWVTYGSDRWPGMLNAGFRPTVDGNSMTVEVHLIGFSGDLYGQAITIDFIERIREERKFPGIPELKAQLELDRSEALRLLS